VRARVSRDLPFVQREGIRLVTASHADQDAALRAIDEGLRNFYASQAGSGDPQAVARSVSGVQEVRCHDESHTAKDGTTISADCEMCHKQVE
jgi:hypothetical protein